MTKRDEVVALQEMMLANSIELDALIQVLFKKGIITEAELLEAVREMKQRMLGQARPGST